MEKISGIIPRNSRNSSVDLSKSQPVRPGAPSFGRPIGKVTPRTFTENTVAKQVQSGINPANPFMVDNKKLSEMTKIDFQEAEATQDKVTISPEVKELQKLKAIESESGNEIITDSLDESENANLELSQAEPNSTTGKYNRLGKVT